MSAAQEADWSGTWRRAFRRRRKDPPPRAIVLPIAQPAAGTPPGCLVAGLSDFRPLDEAYRGFLDLIAGQIATAIGAARALEEERRHSEAMAELDAAKMAFFANVSHEFRTPLTLLLAPLEDTLAQPGDALSPADRERLILAHHNAQRLLKLVNMLLEFSRIEAGRVQASREPTDLAAFTSDLASMFRSTIERAGMRLVVDCPPLSRPGRWTATCGRRSFSTSSPMLSNLHRRAKSRSLLREVGDEAGSPSATPASGIPEDEVPRLFQRFHRIPGVPAGRSRVRASGWRWSRSW